MVYSFIISVLIIYKSFPNAMPDPNIIVITIDNGKTKIQFLYGESKKFIIHPIFAVKKNTTLGTIGLSNDLKFKIPISSVIGGIKSIIYAALIGR